MCPGHLQCAQPTMNWRQMFEFERRRLAVSFAVRGGGRRVQPACSSGCLPATVTCPPAATCWWSIKLKYFFVTTRDGSSPSVRTARPPAAAAVSAELVNGKIFLASRVTGDAAQAHGCCLELETKVAEDYAKFYNHGELLDSWTPG